MYPYHNRILQRIRNGELLEVKKGKDEYAIVLVFATPPYLRPIKFSALYRYEKVFSERGITLPK